MTRVAGLLSEYSLKIDKTNYCEAKIGTYIHAYASWYFQQKRRSLKNGAAAKGDITLLIEITQ